MILNCACIIKSVQIKSYNAGDVGQLFVLESLLSIFKCFLLGCLDSPQKVLPVSGVEAK